MRVRLRDDGEGAPDWRIVTLLSDQPPATYRSGLLASAHRRRGQFVNPVQGEMMCDVVGGGSVVRAAIVVIE
jgi:hypothetical protein